MQTQPHPRQLNHSSALASAEDDFEMEVRMHYQVPTGSIGPDLDGADALAVLTAEYVKGFENILKGMTYAADPERRFFKECLLDLIDDQMQHGAGAVVKAQFLKMESGK